MAGPVAESLNAQSAPENTRRHARIRKTALADLSFSLLKLNFPTVFFAFSFHRRFRRIPGSGRLSGSPRRACRSVWRGGGAGLFKGRSVFPVRRSSGAAATWQDRCVRPSRFHSHRIDRQSGGMLAVPSRAFGRADGRFRARCRAGRRRQGQGCVFDLKGGRRQPDDRAVARDAEELIVVWNSAQTKRSMTSTL